MKILVLAAAIFVAPLSSAHAQTPADATTTVGRVQQLRIYTLYDNTKEAFHARFRDHAMRIMARHGFRIIALWEARKDDRPELVYLLDWSDEATMKKAWAAFMADEEWIAIKRQTPAEHSPMVAAIEEKVIRLTPYSPAIAAQ